MFTKLKLPLPDELTSVLDRALNAYLNAWWAQCPGGFSLRKEELEDPNMVTITRASGTCLHSDSSLSRTELIALHLGSLSAPVRYYTAPKAALILVVQLAHFPSRDLPAEGLAVRTLELASKWALLKDATQPSLKFTCES
jgi:hypothetical protein